MSNVTANKEMYTYRQLFNDKNDTKDKPPK